MRPGTDTVPIEEAAKRLGVNRSTIYAGMDAGEIPCIKLGKRRCIPRAAFELLMSLGQRGMVEITQKPPIDLEQIKLQLKRELLEIQKRSIEMQLHDSEPLSVRMNGGR